MKNKKILITTLAVFLLISIMAGVKKANDWFNGHYFVFNQPIKVNLLPPMEVKIRKPQIIEKKLILSYPDEIDTPIEKYICEKFGVYDCKTALAVFKAESGLREDAFNINTNNTIDVGIAQINSIHFKKSGCSLKEIVNAEKNVDCAYTIYKQQGWTPWVAYNNGNWLAKYEE